MLKTYTFLFLLIASLVQSQSIDTVKLDKYFSALEKNNKFMGSVALLKEGKIVYQKTIGFSDVENKVKPTADTKYRIGSISKTFTATLIMKAVEEEKIKLEDTLDKFFPEVKNADKISVENLLNHRSGIHNFTDDALYMMYNTQPKSRKEMLDIIVASGTDFEPNEKSAYSNSNYVLLSYLLEDIYKKTFSEIVKEKIVTPLALNNTFFGEKINPKNNEANSYRYTGKWIKSTETNMAIPMGAGGIVSTPTDLTLFADALFNGKLISKKSIATMMQIKDSYGLGLFQIPFNTKISYGHTGGIDGFTSVFSYFPEDKISFAMVSNGSNYNTNNISITLLKAVYNIPFDIPSFKTFKVAEEDFKSYVGVYASTQIPLKITITNQNNTLIAQATGQPSFPLEATEKHKFKFDVAGVVLEFSPEKNQMILKQGGGIFTFTKE